MGSRYGPRTFPRMARVVIPGHDCKKEAKSSRDSEWVLEYIRTWRTVDARKCAGFSWIDLRAETVTATVSRRRTSYNIGSSLMQIKNTATRTWNHLPETNAMSNQKKRWDSCSILGSNFEYESFELQRKLSCRAHLVGWLQRWRSVTVCIRKDLLWESGQITPKKGPKPPKKLGKEH
ncbi:hypothetical protein DFH06DRAFT_1364359 [Mycena polygramma]|nr:hypothetical protein DFH06DRAFT_1364359 [Mycena polygramma]